MYTFEVIIARLIVASPIGRRPPDAELVISPSVVAAAGALARMTIPEIEHEVCLIIWRPIMKSLLV